MPSASLLLRDKVLNSLQKKKKADEKRAVKVRVADGSYEGQIDCNRIPTSR
jgi:hypothetical protein